MVDARRRALGGERGVALSITLLVMVLLSALGLSLTMITSTGERVASSYRDASEAFYAADMMVEHVVEELSRVPDWTQVLDGSVTSPFVDRAVVTRGWPDRGAQTPAEATSLVRCDKVACTTADLDARTVERPWGPNNPRWQLFAYGPVSLLGQAGPPGVLPYVAAWVADDPSENDGLPLVDGDATGGPNPGHGVVSVLAHAYGGSGTRRVIEATVARTATGVRVLSWREDR